MFSLQVLGAVAQLERALIAERTKAGLRAARSRGRVGGNPGLRAGDSDAIRKVRASRDGENSPQPLHELKQGKSTPAPHGGGPLRRPGATQRVKIVFPPSN